MGMIDRYKKPGGFVQLLALVETSPLAKQTKFLELIKQENPAWEEAISQRLLSIDRIFSWPPEALLEITGRVPTLYLAAIKSSSPELSDKLLAGVASLIKKQIDETLSYKTFTPAEVSTCKEKLITETRQLISTGILKTDKFDPTLSIQDDIEEKLNSVSVFAKNPSFDNKNVSSSQKSKALQNEAAAGPTQPSLNEQTTVLHDEINFLKKKLASTQQEIITLKQDLALAHDKLDKIRKIA